MLQKNLYYLKIVVRPKLNPGFLFCSLDKTITIKARRTSLIQVQPSRPLMTSSAQIPLCYSTQYINMSTSRTQELEEQYPGYLPYRHVQRILPLKIAPNSVLPQTLQVSRDLLSLACKHRKIQQYSGASRQSSAPMMRSLYACSIP